ncbi:MAG: nucleotidyltransferase family protein [Acidimicrobiales bacterium]|nr:nucleotidyltransferase family protein [Acidimicrobiales bacterium]
MSRPETPAPLDDAADLSPDQRAAVARFFAAPNRRATRGVVDALRTAGIDVIVLKGVATQQLLYPMDPRVSCDVDVLVAPADRRRCRRRLRELGYRPVHLGTHATTWRAPGRQSIDAHLTLPRCARSPRTVWRLLVRHRTEIDVDGAMVPVLAPEAMAVHLTLHGAQSAGERQLEDLRRAVAQLDDPTWAAAARLADDLGVVPTFAWALDQVPGGAARRDRLGLAPVPTEALPQRKLLEGSARGFVTSSVHWRERWRDLVGSAQRAWRRRWSDHQAARTSDHGTEPSTAARRRQVTTGAACGQGPSDRAAPTVEAEAQP